MDYQRMKEEMKKRRERIVVFRKKGWTLQRIAGKEKITVQRVSQILKKEEQEAEAAKGANGGA